MDYLLWSLPLIGILATLLLFRTTALVAGTVGLALAVPVSVFWAPKTLGIDEAVNACTIGAWVGISVGAVLLGGLFFRRAVYDSLPAPQELESPPATDKRRTAFRACFLLGPFAESATGYGVGQLVIAPVLGRLGLKPTEVAVLGLFSQILVPWGALANGTIVGAQFAGVQSSNLGLHSAIISLPLLLAWLALFWRIAAAAGIKGSSASYVSEAAYVVVLVLLLASLSYTLGPEVAGMAALGIVISVSFALTNGLTKKAVRSTLPTVLPFVCLIVVLIAVRAVPGLNALAKTFEVRPTSDAPPLYLFLHPAFWLFAIGSGLFVVRNGWRVLARNFAAVWTAGKRSLFSIIAFLAISQILSASGMAEGLADGLKALLGPAAILIVPLLGGVFGYITSASSVSNGLLMHSQVTLAGNEAGKIIWIAAIQNVAAAALTMVSPVRLALISHLAGTDERGVLRKVWPLALAPLVILSAVAGWVVLSSGSASIFHGAQIRHIVAYSR